jgi:hypothetical protein
MVRLDEKKEGIFQKSNFEILKQIRADCIIFHFSVTEKIF